ncbi:hypothetical protein ACFQ36_05285 [Arthrobacter sp. GCM10027362]|uniref:DUF7793 family protein n=1 Tax=Arthrobacter sp. GCM10027362 TaxID=3273379 RepID=UPI00362EBE7E
MRGPLPVTAAVAEPPDAAIRRLADGVVHVRWAAGFRVEELHARSVLARAHELGGGSLHQWLVELSAIASASPAAMAAFARRSSISRMALVGSSPADGTLAKFFHAVHRPPYPVKYFTSHADALAWLKEYSGGSPGTGAGQLPPADMLRDSPAESVPAGPVRIPAAAPGPAEAGARRSHPHPPGRGRQTRRMGFRKTLTGMVAAALGPAAADVPRTDGTVPGNPDPAPQERHVPAETLARVAAAYRGRTRLKSFPRALAVAGALDYDDLSGFTGLLSQCPAAERDLIATHLYRHYLHSPGKLGLWVRMAGDNYFHAKAQVANTGLRKARPRPGKISSARKTDRDSAGFNVRQEARDAISLINGLAQSPWPGHIGVAAQRNIISLGASLARLLIAEGDRHGLAGSYREYTDLYDVRYSIVEHGTGLIDLVLKHPQAVGLLCEYIDSGKYDSPEELRRAVLGSSLVLRQQPSPGARH